MGVLYVGNVGCGLVGLQLVNVPMFFALRRLVSPMILVYEYVALGKIADPSVRGAIGVIMVGTIIAGWDSLGNDILGYIITMLNNLFTAAASVMQKQFSDAQKLSTFSIVYYNAIVACPLTLACALVTGEFTTLMKFEYLYDPKFLFAFFISSVMGLLLTYSSMLCTTYNSPLATSVTGNVKDVVTTVYGAIAFSGFVATVKSVGGLVLSFTGAFIYSYVNLKKAMAAPQGSSAKSEVASKSDPTSTQGTSGPSSSSSTEKLKDIEANSAEDTDEKASLVVASSVSATLTSSASERDLFIPETPNAASGTIARARLIDSVKR
jgi:solute carrier family 35